jgi:uncharacterized protein
VPVDWCFGLVFAPEPAKDGRFSMPSEPVQSIFAVLECALLLAGAFLIFRLAANPGPRARWLGTNRLPAWPVTPVEFALYVFLILGSGLLFQSAVQILLDGPIARAPDGAGLKIFIYGTGLEGGGLLGWLLFRSMQKTWPAGYIAMEPPPVPPAPALPWSRVVLCAGGILLVALTVMTALSLGWVFLLRRLGLPEDLQEAIAIFSNAKSPLVIAGMLAVACGLAPLNEELLFRAGIYRFCRQKLGRNPALLISGGLFGAMHANWAGFLPLAVFGIILAMAYEATGDIRVSVVAHGLFNLHTILFVLSGLSQ